MNPVRHLVGTLGAGQRQRCTEQEAIAALMVQRKTGCGRVVDAGLHDRQRGRAGRALALPRVRHGIAHSLGMPLTVLGGMQDLMGLSRSFD